jgi:hypothetical protein
MKITVEGPEYVAYDEHDLRILAVGAHTVTIPVNGYGEKDLCVVEAIYDYGRPLALEQQALKAIFEAIREEFGEFPYVDNQNFGLDEKELQLLSYLIEAGLLPEKYQTDLEFSIGSPALARKEVKKNLINATTDERVPGSRFNGHVPSASKVITRRARNFANARTEQLLRQIATQLYNLCCRAGLDPIEVQVMHAAGSLFISTNIATTTRVLHKYLVDAEKFKSVLARANSDQTRSKDDLRISSRHGKKLHQRLYGSCKFADARANDIKQLLQEKFETHLISLPETRNKSSTIKTPPYYRGRGIYFIEYPFKKDRHAEENLMDMLENMLKVTGLPDGNNPAIFGKKRPCFTCHSRLAYISRKYSEELSQPPNWLEFNPHMGFLYKGAAYMQGLAEAEATATALAYAGAVHVSEIGDSSYATGSDSDDEAPAANSTRLTVV